jgi:predicted nuclease with RNAse H fold
MKPIDVMGIDLAGSPRRPTGICRLRALKATTQVAYSDKEILESFIDGIQLVAIDAPLSLPRGRCCLRNDCTCAGISHFRECDLALREMGIRFFPITLGPMRMLTERGMQLKARLEKEGFAVMEAFPGGAQDILGMPRQKDPGGLRRSLKRYGISGDVGKRGISVHELDAITCALVARLHVQGKSLVIGDPREGQMIMPAPPRRMQKRRNR